MSRKRSGVAALIVFGFSMLGLIISLILQMLYDEGILVHEAISEAAMLQAIQVIVIIICILLGVIVAALSSS